MAEAVATAMAGGEHLLVQAGTGTGKSLAYLVPALLHDSRVVVATATLALQHQLVERDLPRLVEAVAGQKGVDASYAVLKGRSNYACLHRIRSGVPDEQGALIEVPQGSMATKVLELRAWAEEEVEGGGTGERDHAPRHTDREWRQVSVNHRECLGAAKCPFGQECFAELAREKAQRSHLIVTNHSLLAIDAIEGVPMIPDYDVVVVDEAHELVSRVTQAATDELCAADVDRAARRSQAPRRRLRGRRPRRRRRRGCARSSATSPGRLDALPDDLGTALSAVRDAARAACRRTRRWSVAPGEADAGMTQAKGAVQELFVTAERMAAGSEHDVLWLSEGTAQRPPHLAVAPLQVWGPMRDKLLTDKTRRLHQRHAAPGRRLHRRRLLVRAQGHRAGRARPDPRAHRGRAALARARRRQPVRLRPAGDPVRRTPPAAARSGRPRPGPARRDRRAGRRQPTVARSGCSPPVAPPRPPPRWSASGCRT